MLSWAERCPRVAFAHAGATYAGLPQSPDAIDDQFSPSQYVDGAPVGAAPGHRPHHPAPPCALRQVNYLLGWASAGYRFSFFEDGNLTDPAHLQWLQQDVGCLESCSKNSAWLDDQYISGHLNAAGVPIYLLPFPRQGRWHALSFHSEARQSRDRKHLGRQTAWMLMHFRGTGQEAWNLPVTHHCTPECRHARDAWSVCKRELANSYDLL